MKAVKRNGCSSLLRFQVGGSNIQNMAKQHTPASIGLVLLTLLSGGALMAARALLDWTQSSVKDTLLKGANSLAALTFREVPIASKNAAP
jgi:hypothetical protein